MKYIFKKSASVFLLGALSIGASGVSYAAETVCNNNGGAGWPFAVSSTTNINIPYLFGDVSTAFDVDYADKLPCQGGIKKPVTKLLV